MASLLIGIPLGVVSVTDSQGVIYATLAALAVVFVVGMWVIAAYALTLAAFLLMTGSLGDRLGRRRVFNIGFGIFTLASFLCGIAGDATLLNLARGLQGVGAAAMFSTSLALIAQEFDGRDRATAIGAWGATVGGAVAVGPLIGGLLTEGVGWEWIFFANIPIGIGAMILTATRVANVKATEAVPLDWAGLFTFSGGLFLLIFGLIRGNPEGWSSGVILASLIGAGVLLVAFLIVEARQE